MTIRELRISLHQPTARINTMDNTVPDPDWIGSDKAGHLHRWQPDEHGKLNLVTGAIVVEGDTWWCDTCCDEHRDSWWACAFCGDRLQPGWRPGPPVTIVKTGPVEIAATWLDDEYRDLDQTVTLPGRDETFVIVARAEPARRGNLYVYDAIALPPEVGRAP